MPDPEPEPARPGPDGAPGADPADGAPSGAAESVPAPVPSTPPHRPGARPPRRAARDREATDAGPGTKPGGTGPRRRERDPSLPPRISRGRERDRGDDDGGGRRPLRDRPFGGLQGERTPQYLVIGHIVADLLDDGRVVLGGTALYSALTAARLGWRVGVLTRGAYGRTVDGLAIPSLDEFADEVSIITQETDGPTVFVNEYSAGRRTQTIRRWAGPIDLRGLPPHWRNARVVHLGPVAQEIDARQTGALTPGFLGATPQGWMRDWPRATGGRVKLGHLRLPAELLGRLDAVVVSDEEIHLARDTVERVGGRRLGVVTLGDQGARIVYGGERVELPGFPVKTLDLTGAGDVFAAAFFVRAADRDASAVTAGRFANAVAALSLRGVGPSAVPTLAEVEAALAAGEDRVARR